MKRLLCCGLALMLTSCSWQKSRSPSVLVILVEQLGFNSFSCGEEGTAEVRGGYSVFCAESVRFTHAYAPSPLSQASVASVLSGLYPYQHGIRHNGVSERGDFFPSVALSALKHNFHTSFFSGGPPIFRKSGFNRGFETFDDSFNIAANSYFKPARELIKQFLSWHETEVGRASFFSVLYLADLQFPDIPTANALGETRDLSWASQNAALDAALGELIKTLKDRKIWDDTAVFLVGLNAHEEEIRAHEITPLNLHTDNLRVRLMIKPPRKAGRESPFNWKIDANISLADVGQTLFDLIDANGPSCAQLNEIPGPASCGGPAMIASLKSVLDGPEPKWPQDRQILTESAWAQWRHIGKLRYAVRRGPYLFLADRKATLYNTFADPFEQNPLDLRGKSDSGNQNLGLVSELGHSIEMLKASPWDSVPIDLQTKIILGKDVWRSQGPSPSGLIQLKELTSHKPVDMELAGWRASLALRNEDWKDLKLIGEIADQRFWTYVGASNLGIKDVHLPTDPCLTLVRASRKNVSALPDLRECLSPEVLDLIAWMDENLSPAQKSRAQESFVRSMGWLQIDQAVAERNLSQCLTWETHAENLGAPRSIHLLLALPEMRKYKLALLKLLGSKEKLGP